MSGWVVECLVGCMKCEKMLHHIPVVNPVALAHAGRALCVLCVCVCASVYVVVRFCVCNEVIEDCAVLGLEDSGSGSGGRLTGEEVFM